MRRQKRYARYRDPLTGQTGLRHRRVAQEMLGRPLLPGEVVHHRDGNSLNNQPENLLVLPSQRHHAHLEFRLRRERSGQPSLFPDVIAAVNSNRQGTLFEHLLLEAEFASGPDTFSQAVVDSSVDIGRS